MDVVAFRAPDDLIKLADSIVKANSKIIKSRSEVMRIGVYLVYLLTKNPTGISSMFNACTLEILSSKLKKGEMPIVKDEEITECMLQILQHKTAEEMRP